METIEARVIQKIATPEQWRTISYTPYKGEILIVGDASGKVTNIKVGDGSNDFDGLEYMFDSIQQNANYIPVSGYDLPTPEADSGFTILVEGDYTFGGNPAFTVTDGNFGIASWDGSSWSLEGMAELPEAENKIPSWSASAYVAGSQVNFAGQIYESTSPVTSEEIPGESISWVPILNIPKVKRQGAVNLLDPESIITGKTLSCTGGAPVDDTAGGAKLVIIRGLKAGTDYYIQGRGSRNQFRYFNDLMEPYPYTYEPNACGGPSDGVYRTPDVDNGGINAIFLTYWNGQGVQPENVMFFEGSEPLDSFVPYSSIAVGIDNDSIGAEYVKDDDGSFRTPVLAFDNKFVLGGGSINVFDKETMVQYGLSLSSIGSWVSSETSAMSTPILVDKTKSHLLIQGRSRAPLVFRRINGSNIPSDFGPDYNAGPANGVYPIPEDAHDFVFAITFQGSGSADNIMAIFGDSEDIPIPPNYVPYEQKTVQGIKIGGVVYPLADGGGDTPTPSSFKNQAVRYDGLQLDIVANHSDTENLKLIFKDTGNNETFLPNSAGKISRENNEITVSDLDKSFSVNMLRWHNTDGIGPYRVDSSLFVGGNHGQPEPPPYLYKTSNMLEYGIWADGVKMNPNDIVDASIVMVRVVNEVYNATSLVGDPSEQIVDFHEVQTHIIKDGQLITNVVLRAVRSITFRTIYGLQMQVVGDLNRIYFPNSEYTDVDPTSVNPNTGDGRSYGAVEDYPDFEKFIVMPTTNQDCTSVWINQNVGLGDKSRLTPTGPVARGKLGKLYHNLLNVYTSLEPGEELEYEGGANIFANLEYPTPNVFAYFQNEQGELPYTIDRFLYLDFAGSETGRSITIDYTEIIGRTLTVVEKSDNITTPNSFVVSESGTEVSCSGHGGVKFKIS